MTETVDGPGRTAATDVPVAFVPRRSRYGRDTNVVQGEGKGEGEGLGFFFRTHSRVGF